MKRNTFTNSELGICGEAPDGWMQAQPDIWLRQSSESDPIHLVQNRVGGLICADILAISQEELEAPPAHAGRIESPNFTWNWYRGKPLELVPRVVDIALGQRGNWVYIVVLGTTPEEIDNLHEAVFLPAVHTLAPAEPDAVYARQRLAAPLREVPGDQLCTENRAGRVPVPTL